ncbi:MAG: hypothetical protein IJ068_07870 [Bacilli bacterium]|nr:hypothetical protein [Bacilli bacterium]
MNKILSNIFKGLLVALVLVVTTGVISLNMKVSPNTSMVLVSSSLVNSIKTEEKNVEVVSIPELDILEENTEIVEDTKEVEEVKEEKIEPVEIKEEKELEKKEEVVEVKPEPVVVQEEKKEPVQSTPSVPAPSTTYTPNNDAAGNSGVLATYTGLVTAYGPDCAGCYGAKTAMGDYVGEGNIYYNHPTYGTIRIVAGDKSILNKVVRIIGLNVSSEPVIAIVRDTGGDIGFNKPKGIILDLLYTSERSPEVLNFGMQQATVEVLS